jgi:hypothetical protein
MQRHINYSGISELQASSLTVTVGFDRIYLERNNMDTTQLKRIADALEEVLRLVKEDQERSRKYMEQPEEGDMRDHFKKKC